MSSLCYRCALRLRAAASSRASKASRNDFSTSTAKQRHSLPEFTTTSQPELDSLLASVRDKWLLPAALTGRERRMIYAPRFKQFLEENDEKVTIGEENIPLRYRNIQTDVPSLKKTLLPKIIELLSTGQSSDWKILPALLIGLKDAKLTPEYNVMGKIARKAVEGGHFGVILACLQQSELTQMTLKKEEVLYNIVYGLRQLAQQDYWREASTSKAVRDVHEIAKLLESEEHGGGRQLRDRDPRIRPELLAVYLELAAVYAYKHQDGKDADGKVKAYANRLLSNMQSIAASSDTEGEVKAKIRPATLVPVSKGPQMEILQGVPIYHALSLATKILGSKMPMPELAQQVLRNWETGLTALTDGVKMQTKEKAHGLNRWPSSGTHDWQALQAWKKCIHVQPT